MIGKITLKTPCAHTEVIKEEDILRQNQYFESNKIAKQLLNAVNYSVVIINDYSQIVFLNNYFLNVLKIKDKSLLLGKCTEEITNNTHKHEKVDRCVNNEKSRYYDAIYSFLKSIKISQEILGKGPINTTFNGLQIAYDILENATQTKSNKEKYYVISLKDISDDIKRKELERVFFHDIINSLGGLMNFMSLISKDIPYTIKDSFSFITKEFQNTIEEIQFHRNITNAENNDFECNIKPINIGELLKTVVDLFKNDEFVKEKIIIISEGSKDGVVFSDYIILKKTLVNMLKNAIEATSSGDTITIGYNDEDKTEDIAEFWVHNDGFIPPEVLPHIFQKSFSTKGQGRGLGTYSMKLFIENYLNGKVSFISDENIGTKFFIRVPSLK